MNDSDHKQDGPDNGGHEPGHDMIDEDHRAELLQRDAIMLVVVLLSLSNGMHFSPLFDHTLFLIAQMTQTIFADVPLLVTYTTSLFLSTVTLMVSGIPAALYERATGREETDSKSCGVWAGAAFVFALPSVLAFFGVFG